MMKRVIRAMIGIILLLAVVPLSASAAATPNIVIDGKAFAAPKGEPAPYINKDDRTMIPIRFFAAALGVPNDEAHIAWDADTKTAGIVSEDRAVFITVGKREIVVNGDIVIMDTAAEIKNGRVFIPARYLAEALGCNVQWDGANNRVIIYTPKYLENHKVMITGNVQDIRTDDEEWLIYPLYEKWKHRVDIGSYESADVLFQRVQEVRRLAAKVKIEKDEKKQRYIITIPEYDQTKYYVILGAPALGTPVDPGVYHVYFKDTHPETRYVFGFGISDRRTGAYTLYRVAVYDVDGVHQTFYGSDIDKHRESMGL